LRAPDLILTCEMNKREEENLNFEAKQQYKISTSYELQRKIDIECYDKVMESHQNYLTIVYIYISKAREKLSFLHTKNKIKTQK
jgi:hypothetical protein